MKISVVIPTHNRKDALARCLAGLAQGSRQPDQIIIVNDCSNDGTRSYLAKLGQKNFLVVNSASHLGKSEARNTGIRLATGEVILCIDDDCVPDKQWIEQLLIPFKDDALDFAIGSIIYRDEKIHGRFPERIVQNEKALWPMTASMAYRKRFFEKVGFFDPSFDAICKEDLEIAVRAVSRGLRYVSVARAKVRHEKSLWTATALLRSARNSSIWPILKKRYPHHYKTFHPPLTGDIVQIQEYILLLVWPVLLIPLFVQYWRRGNRSIGLFIAKWPLFFILKRLFVFWESIRQKKFVI